MDVQRILMLLAVGLALYFLYKHFKKSTYDGVDMKQDVMVADQVYEGGDQAEGMDYGAVQDRDD